LSSESFAPYLKGRKHVACGHVVGMSEYPAQELWQNNQRKSAIRMAVSPAPWDGNCINRVRRSMDQAHGRPAPFSMPEQGDDHGGVRAGRSLLQPAQGDHTWQGVYWRLSGG